MRIRVLGFGRRGRREWESPNGILGGVGIVLVGPIRDQGANAPW